METRTACWCSAWNEGLPSRGTPRFIPSVPTAPARLVWEFDLDPYSVGTVGFQKGEVPLVATHTHFLVSPPNRF